MSSVCDIFGESEEEEDVFGSSDEEEGEGKEKGDDV